MTTWDDYTYSDDKFKACISLGQPNPNNFIRTTLDTRPDGSKHLKVFLVSYILPIQYYVPIISFLHMAKENDSCTFYIDNRGGVLATGIAIHEAIKYTRCQVFTNAMTIAASSAALIFSSASNRTALPMSFVMYHTASYGSCGKTNVHEAVVSYTKGLIMRILGENMTDGLLEQEELKLIEDGVDIFLQSSEINKRILKKKGNDHV